MEFETELVNCIRDGIRTGVADKLKGYSSPLDKLINAAIEKHSTDFRKLMDDAIASCLKDAAFRESIAGSVRHTLAKTLVARFGGEMEKQVNALKSDPMTRARITLAIEEIVKQKAS